MQGCSPSSGTWSPATLIRTARQGAIADTILTKVHPGAIIVAHANGRGWHTAQALALAIPKLKDEGFSFLTVSELLKAGKPVITTSCYLNKPGDNTRIAHAAGRDGAPDALSIFEYPY